MMRRMGMLGVLGAAWALSGCSSAPTRSYTLYTIAPHDTGQTAAKLAIVPSTTSPRVRIDAVHIPPAFDRVEVVTRVGRGELKINDSDHWSASLAQLARQTLERRPCGTLAAGFGDRSAPEQTRGSVGHQRRHSGTRSATGWRVALRQLRHRRYPE